MVKYLDDRQVGYPYGTYTCIMYGTYSIYVRMRAMFWNFEYVRE